MKKPLVQHRELIAIMLKAKVDLIQLFLQSFCLHLQAVQLLQYMEPAEVHIQHEQKSM